MLPVDETRYASVAWEMRLRGDWLVPWLFGEPYSDKGPVLFWLIRAGWVAFGVVEWWPRLVAPACGALALVVIVRIARELWPDRERVAALAPLVLVANLVFCGSSTLLVTDPVLDVFVQLSLLALVLAARRGGWRPWALMGAAIALGVLTKGPVAFLHVVPLALLAPAWSRSIMASKARWYGGLAAAIAIAASLALAWALPAARAGGPAYGDAILWGQTAGRVVRSFAHVHPWWWLLAFFPVLLLPHVAWPRAWRGARELVRDPLDEGTRFCLLGIALPLFLLSLSSGKQVHYLLPEVPLIALLVARVLDQRAAITGPGATAASDRAFVAVLPGVGALLLIVLPLVARARSGGGVVREAIAQLPWWPAVVLVVLCLAAWRWPGDRGVEHATLKLALAVIAVAIVAHLGPLRALGPAYDLAPAAAHLREAELRRRPIVRVGRYEGEYQFLGRLERSPPRIERGTERGWLASHPDGLVVTTVRGDPRLDETLAGLRIEHEQPYRSQTLVLLGR